MKAPVLITAFAVALLLGAAAPPQTPEEEWKAGIADANVAWAKRPHAILKIQDSAYLHDGDTAVLQGTAGKPGSIIGTTIPRPRVC